MTGPRQGGPQAWGLRLAAEFAIILLGVFGALAADRWAQGRDRAELEAEYIERFIGEIRNDSLVAAAYMEDFAGIMAARDSLAAFVAGGPQPPSLPATVRHSFLQLDLPPAATWDEILSANSLGIIRRRDVREALTTYYGRREVQVRNIGLADRRGRDPFVDALYPLGLFEPCLGHDDCVPLMENAAPEQFFREVDPSAFRAYPGMAALLTGLGSGHGGRRLFGRSVLEATGSALRVLEAAWAER